MIFKFFISFPLYSILVVSTASIVASADVASVSLSYGTFQGFLSGNLTQFLGIPFGQARRFALPTDPTPFEGVRNATEYGSACPQQKLVPPPAAAGIVPNQYPSVSEDCLTLDIFKPTLHPSPSADKLPVFVWIYGGGFVVGNSRDNDLTPLVERSIHNDQPIIVVTINYRVSALGFLPGKEAAAAGITNLALRDQTFALQWIQKHIAAFGGDLTRVVVGGVSAGSMSTAYLLLDNSLNSNQLFRGVFMQSGTVVPTPTLSSGQATYDSLVSATGCHATDDTLQCLRHLPLDTLMAAVNTTANFFSYEALNLVWRPRVDGVVVKSDPWVAIARGEYGSKIPIMAGMCDDEGTLFATSSVNVTTNTEFLAFAHSYFLNISPLQMSELARLYPDDPTKGSPFDTGTANQLSPEYKRISALSSDFFFTSPRRFLSEHASKRQPVWGWLNKVGKISNAYLGALHASDAQIWFTETSSLGMVGMDALINFVNALDPNHPSAANDNAEFEWPKWNFHSRDGKSSLLTFNDDGVNVTADNFREEAVEFLNGVRCS
ncbi:carboxylic ester hydrolase [Favolaschia claudopus]|uniref:Carboxylic ester hydrolase n=1 Tax=Favolaschia claudopus TaxID=2862362 RepID=A0AAV9ZII1_9AGAR